MISTKPRRRSVPLIEWLRDALYALPFVLGLLFASEKQARAYTDPGTGALIWQMLAAGFVGLMFYFRKFTTWFRGRKSGASASTDLDSPSADPTLDKESEN
jgi:hypothetical protein